MKPIMSSRRSLEGLQISAIRVVDLVYDISLFTRDAKLIAAFGLRSEPKPAIKLLEIDHEWLHRTHCSP
jgi:hypothetical protein